MAKLTWRGGVGRGGNPSSSFVFVRFCVIIQFYTNENVTMPIMGVSKLSSAHSPSHVGHVTIVRANNSA